MLLLWAAGAGGAVGKWWSLNGSKEGRVNAGFVLESGGSGISRLMRSSEGCYFRVSIKQLRGNFL